VVACIGRGDRACTELSGLYSSGSTARGRSDDDTGCQCVRADFSSRNRRFDDKAAYQACSSPARRPSGGNRHQSRPNPCNCRCPQRSIRTILTCLDIRPSNRKEPWLGFEAAHLWTTSNENSPVVSQQIRQGLTRCRCRATAVWLPIPLCGRAPKSCRRHATRIRSMQRHAKRSLKARDCRAEAYQRNTEEHDRDGGESGQVAPHYIETSGAV
jgi:hypothetical protein